MNIFIIYLLIINIISLAIMYTDKKSAENRLWRIPEKVIFSIASLGGSIGVYLGMYLFRHKTQKMKFRYGIPTIIIIQIFLSKNIVKIIEIFMK